MTFEEFLKESLLELDLIWRRYNRKGVRRAIIRHMESLRLFSFEAYRDYLNKHPQALAHFRGMLSVTITRFFRDIELFEALPALLVDHFSRHSRIECWSAGCASGEEPYSLAILWHERLRSVMGKTDFHILATDINHCCLERARIGRYPKGCLREIPPDLSEEAFIPQGNDVILKEKYRPYVTFMPHDLIESPWPEKPMDIILCRNLAFTYFKPIVQGPLLEKFRLALNPSGFLIIGRTERIPDLGFFMPYDKDALIWRAC